MHGARKHSKPCHSKLTGQQHKKSGFQSKGSAAVILLTNGSAQHAWCMLQSRQCGLQGSAPRRLPRHRPRSTVREMRLTWHGGLKAYQGRCDTHSHSRPVQAVRIAYFPSPECGNVGLKLHYVAARQEVRTKEVHCTRPFVRARPKRTPQIAIHKS